MFTQFKLALVASAATLLIAGQTSAQGPRGGGMGMPGGPNLSRNKSVQEELKVSTEQAEKLDQAAEATREKFREELQELRDASQEERREKMEALTKKMEVETHKSLAAILSPDQHKRFVQIERQQNVLPALMHADVRSQIKLSDDQVAQIKTIQEDLQKARPNFQGGQGGDRRQAMEKFQASRKEAGDKAVALLTDEQKSTWKDLVGAPFEVKYEAPRPR